MNRKNLLITAGISGAVAVGLGAFGAHGLEPMLRAAGRIDTFETAVSYHFYHTLLLVAIAAVYSHLHEKFRGLATVFTMAGILIFSGSLYVLCLSGVSWLGAVTPVGGLCFIAGWLFLALGAWKNKKAGQN